MTTELRRAFDAARAGSEERSYIFGLLGKPDGTVAVSGQPGYLYVRVSNEADRTLTTARNPYAVPQRAGLPVKMRRERGQLVIVSIDASRLYDATTTGDTVNPYGVAKHTHLLGTGLEYTVESLRLEPGQLYPAGGLLAGVRAFRYAYAGAWVTFEGDTISLGPYRPSTVGHHAWVLVGINPATNTIVAVAGTSQIYTTPLTIDQIDAIAFSNYIPVGAVRVRNDDTAVTDITKYQDAHEWFGVPVGGVNFLDAEGNPADVTSASADGTSVYAARRDHAHTIAAATVTNAMRANMAQATVSGRAAGAGAGVPTDLTAAQLVAIIITADGAGSTLDADTIDTLNSTAFLILAGQAGGQTGHGGTAANEDLILHGTSHATKATSYVLLQPSGGNVGIGTSTPVSVFQVTAADTPVVTVQTTDTTSTGRALIQMYRDAGANAVGWDLGFNLDQSTGRFDIRELSAGPAVNYRMTILKTSGYVGINQTNPQGRLHVTGSIYIDGDDGGIAGTTGLTDQFNTATTSGTGTIKMCGVTNRNSVGFLKAYVGTSVVWIPIFDTITG